MARWKPQRVVVELACLLAVCAVGVWAGTNALGCGAGEREVFARFPDYEGRVTEPRSYVELGLCRAWFVTPDTRREVYAYYGRELRERGWEVETREPPPRSDEPTTRRPWRPGKAPTGTPSPTSLTSACPAGGACR